MAVKQFLNSQFEKIYNSLNEEQQVAVNTIEGPVMVIAGPGTGKTQILSARIGKILLDTDYLPENILCLTYTDAGVIAMRKRLLSFIGSDAYKVNIHTFHSFCNTVIQENIHYFEKHTLDALSELERVQIIKTLIDGFKADNPLKRFKGEVYYDLNNLSGLYSAIKREGWELEQLQKDIDYYIEYLIPETESFYKKREKANGIIALTQKGKDEVERMIKVKAAVASFETYQQLLSTHNLYDFDDMINWVIQMFDKNPNVLLNYQEQFQYILVDEYQDTSGSQNKLVEQLISYWGDNPNLFVVGDDDQSIYRFQGANLQNMMNLAQKYEQEIVRVVLTKNYRSVQPILDGAKLLIENNQQRLVHQYSHLTKELIASNATLKELTIAPEIRVYDNEFDENAHITFSIKQLIKDGVTPGKIAVIYREHKFGDELLQFFQLEAIPFYVKKSINLLKDEFILKIINLIRYVVSELDTPFSGEYFLFEILHYDFFKINPFTIATICHEIAGNKSKEVRTLRAYLNQLAEKSSGTLFSKDETTDTLVRVGRILENLQKEVYNKSTQHWFEYLINEVGIIGYIMHHPEKITLMNKLGCLFNYLKDATHRNPDLTVNAFVEQLDLLDQNGLTLPFIQTTGTDTGVNLLTSHGSKGLEFEYVFLVGARNDVWEGKRKNNRGFRLPPNVFEQESEAEVTEELRRLFFVAVTRAEKYLYISYPMMKNDGKLLEPSQFVEEIRQPMGLVPALIHLTDEQKLHFTALQFGTIQRPVLEEQDPNYINQLLEGFVMNVTALNNYLDCPLRFYYSNLIRVPAARSEAAQFGTAVHAALSSFLNETMNKKSYPDKAFLLRQYQYFLNNGREVFTKESFSRFLEHGNTILSQYYDANYTQLTEPIFLVTEYPLTKIVWNNIPLKGFVDKIQFWGNDIVITDYKTGSFQKSNSRGEFAAPNGENETIGGNYWRQAVFYQILIDNMTNKNWKVLYSQFDFVEPNDKNKFDVIKLEITPEHIAIVKQQIVDTWQAIQNHELYKGCGKPTCEWCNFAKQYKIYGSLLIEEDV